MQAKDQLSDDASMARNRTAVRPFGSAEKRNNLIKVNAFFRAQRRIPAPYT
jgi:hypothetical protein